jgi:hypothetical protein
LVEVEGKGIQAPTVKVDGEEAILHITNQSVMFEKGGKVSGFLRSAIQMIKPDGDAMLIAYSVGNEVKSVRVEPMTALTSLLIHDSRKGSGSSETVTPAASGALDEVFERLYKETRDELEQRLNRVMEQSRNKSLRLTPEEEKRYGEVFAQMMRMIRTKHGIDEEDPEDRLTTWSLHEQPYDLQLEFIKAMHVSFLNEVAGPRAETADIGYTATGIWPEDMEHVLAHYKLINGPFLTAEFKAYLQSNWKRPENKRKPVITTYA